MKELCASDRCLRAPFIVIGEMVGAKGLVLTTFEVLRTHASHAPSSLVPRYVEPNETNEETLDNQLVYTRLSPSYSLMDSHGSVTADHELSCVVRNWANLNRVQKNAILRIVHFV